MADKIKLFCIPYAGGSASIYLQWQAHLQDKIELCPMELAGRGRRVSEPFYANLQAAIEDIYTTIANDIATTDYALFGHSMGALIVYELMQKIKTLGVRQPLHAFLSGRKPPHIKRKKVYSSLSDEAFEKEVMSLGGTPPEIFQHPELKDLFIPILRNDFKLSETAIKRPKTSKLATAISVLVGIEEEITPLEAEAWELHTSESCDIHFVNGGHFFVLKETKAVTKIINQSLLNYLS